MATTPSASAATDQTAVWLRRIALSTGVLVVLWLLGEIVLLAFAAALVAIALRGMARTLARRSRWPLPLCLALVCVAILGGFALLFILSGPSLAAQAQQLGEQLGVAREHGRAWLARQPWGGVALHELSAAGGQAHGLIGKLGGLVLATFGAAGAALVVLATALYFAASPAQYVDGTLRLFRRARRAHLREVLAAIAQSLHHWLAGQMVSMLEVTVLIYIGLWALGVPVALLLAVIAGVLNFVPYVGALAGAVPALMVAFAAAPQSALWVAALFAAVQFFDGYIVVPNVQRHMTRLPPALTILSQTVFGSLFGVIGVVLATPVLAAGLVLIRMLYVEDLLGDRER